MNAEENKPVEYNGKTYTKYGATQRQRRLETAMRADRQQIELLTQGGADDDTITSAKVKYFQRQDEYVKFSKAMNLPQQWERVTIDGKNALGSKLLKKAGDVNKISSEAVAKLTESDTIKTKKPLEINIQLFAKIPKEKFTMYALDPVKQPDKAKAFKEALGYTKENYQDLIDNMQNNFKEDFMVLKNEDKFGKRYEYVVELTGANGRKANICTGWIKENDSSEPRMTSAYVTKKKVTPNES